MLPTTEEEPDSQGIEENTQIKETKDVKLQDEDSEKRVMSMVSYQSGTDQTNLPESLTNDVEENFDEFTEQSMFNELNKQDPVVLSLLKNEEKRTSKDLQIIVDYMNLLDVCNSFSFNMKKSMSEVAVLAAKDEKNSVLVEDGEELDSWCIIINGTIKVINPESCEEIGILKEGDAFGLMPSKEKQLHKGTMITDSENCQFLVVNKNDYLRIWEESYQRLENHTEDGKIVMVSELRTIDNGSKQGHVLIKATPKRLIDHLLEDFVEIDPTYSEDFLITFPIFIKETDELIDEFLKWFQNPKLIDKALKIIILWINYQYGEFEKPTLKEFLREIMKILTEKKLIGPRKFLALSCSNRTKAFKISFDIPNNEAKTTITLMGGQGYGSGIFVDKMSPGCTAIQAGLNSGDEILSINNKLVENMMVSDVAAIIRNLTHVTLIVKRCELNYQVAKDNINVGSNVISNKKSERSRVSAFFVPSFSNEDINENKFKRKNKILTLFKKKSDVGFPEDRGEIRKTSSIAYSINKEITIDGYSNKATIIALSYNKIYLDGLLERSFCITKVYRDDCNSKYVILNGGIRSKHIVDALVENSGTSVLFRLVIDEENGVKQSGINTEESDLFRMLTFNSRFLVKTLGSGANIEQIVNEVSRENIVSIFKLNPLHIARLLTQIDYNYLYKIDPKEFIYGVCFKKQTEKYKNLTKFEEISNNELYWVVNEILHEPNLSNRVKVLVQFIIIANCCKLLKNYNSFFFIISGLSHTSISRLKQTWEKVPPVYTKLYEDLQQYLDPSRNMSKYRSLLNDNTFSPTLIPILPILKKDLTFINDGNLTIVDDLVNFEKLRMISKEIRKVLSHFSKPAELFPLFSYSAEFQNVKNNGYVCIPFRSVYFTDCDENGYVPLSHLGSCTVASKSSYLSSEQSRILHNLVNNPKKIFDAELMEKKCLFYLKDRFTKLETSSDKLAILSKQIEPPQASINIPSPQNNQTLKKYGTISPSLTLTSLMQNDKTGILTIATI